MKVFLAVASVLALLAVPALAKTHRAATPRAPAPPSVQSDRFTTQAPVQYAQLIGDMRIKGRVDSIVLAGTASTYFSIDSAGNITLTTAGANAINAQTSDVTYTLTVQATNAGGSGTGQAVILAKPKPVAPPVVPNVNFNLQAPVTAGQKVGQMTATGNPTSWAIVGDTTTPASPPAVQNQTLNVTTPVTSGQVVGTATATNNPTAWAITAASPAAYTGYVAINNSGQISVTAAGATYINALPAEEIATLTVTATNAAGTGTGTVVCDPGPGH